MKSQKETLDFNTGCFNRLIMGKAWLHGEGTVKFIPRNRLRVTSTETTGLPGDAVQSQRHGG